jgi:hypothetical protein
MNKLLMIIQEKRPIVEDHCKVLLKKSYPFVEEKKFIKFVFSYGTKRNKVHSLISGRDKVRDS